MQTLRPKSRHTPLPVWEWAALLGCAALFVLRAPYLLSEPRFFAEEGTVYFAAAVRLPWLLTLLRAPHGYYTILPSVASLAATRVPLEHAPLVTTLVALAVQMLPVVLALFRLRAALPEPGHRLALCLVIVFVVNTGEIWLSTVTSQFHLVVAAYLVLLATDVDTAVSESAAWKWMDRAVIAVGGLSSPLVCFLLPAFALRVVRRPDRHAVILTTILTGASAVQVLVFLLGPDTGPGVRFPDLQGWLFAGRFVRQFLLWPITGRQSASFDASDGSEWALAAALLLAAVLVVGLSRRRSTAVLMLLAFASVSMLSLLGSVRMIGGYRYAYAPSVMLIGLFATNVTVPRGMRDIVRTVVSAVAVGAALLAWVPAYRTTLSPWVRPDFPAWSREVAAWRRAPGHRLRIWPQWHDARWELTLPRPPASRPREEGAHHPMRPSTGSG